MRVKPPWYEPHLDAYRDARARNLDEVERGWRRFAVPARSLPSAGGWRDAIPNPETTTHLLRLLESFFEPADAFNYLELGTGFGTNLGSVLRYFKNARAIGVEPNRRRLEVTRWLTGRVEAAFDLTDRLELYESSVARAPLPAGEVDAVFMNAGRRDPEDYASIVHLLDGGYLRDGFVFVGSDPLAPGMSRARERILRDRCHEIRVLTRPDWNLWWFYRTALARRVE